MTSPLHSSRSNRPAQLSWSNFAVPTSSPALHLLLHLFICSAFHPLVIKFSSSPPCVLFPLYPWKHAMYVQRKGTQFINLTDACGLVMQVACKRNWLYAWWTELHTHQHTPFGVVWWCNEQPREKLFLCGYWTEFYTLYPHRRTLQTVVSSNGS